MTLHITYLEDVKGISFNISYSASIGPQHPDTLAKDTLLKENMVMIGLKVEPHLTAWSSTSRSSSMVSYQSTDLCYIVKANSFSSIEAMKTGVLRGFSQYGSTASGREMEYEFDNDSEEKLAIYFNTPREERPGQQIPTEDFSVALSANLTSFFNQANAAIKAEQPSPPQPQQHRCCVIL